ncbi:MAG: molybdopterin-dependent oxidoreductase [Chloroflexi bacterium]|nr:molybdopterin-dependent oxidoreductase [Chloroflexota bacterium]MYD48480.1 molybdopterin-dependent oxidoreductase [Chloroflexota bacterium]
MAGDKRGETYGELPVFEHHHGRPEVWPGLRIDGLVRVATVLTEPELRELTRRSMTADFRCLEGWSVPNQNWEGIPLSVVLDIAGPTPEARYAAVSAADFTIAVPLDADTANILLATRLNGAELPEEHGGPCRLVSVEQACYASVKWVDSITLTATMPEETARDIARARNAGVSSPSP